MEFHAPYVAASDTSRERAQYEDSHGITRERWLLILDLLWQANTDGLTWSEIANITGLHHGQVSGTLSTLHDEAHIVQLFAKRNRSHVYCHATYRDALDAKEIPYRTEPVRTRANARTQALEAVAEAAHKLCYSQSANAGDNWNQLRTALKELKQHND